MGLVSQELLDQYENHSHSYWIYKEIKEALLKRDGPRCCWCGCPVARIAHDGIPLSTIEHLAPRSLGGGSGGVNLLNLAISCKPCNNKRGSDCCSPCDPPSP